MLKKLWREKREGWLFISVALILFLFFSLYPIIDSLIFSFYTSRGIVYKFNGFGNIKRLFDDQMFFENYNNLIKFGGFERAFFNTLKITIIYLVLTLLITSLAAANYAFMTQWNNYMWPLIVLRTNESKTITLTLSSMSSAYFVDYGMLMLAIVISTILMIVIFFSMQKSFVQGMTGSCK